MRDERAFLDKRPRGPTFPGKRKVRGRNFWRFPGKSPPPVPAGGVWVSRWHGGGVGAGFVYKGPPQMRDERAFVDKRPGRSPFPGKREVTGRNLWRFPGKSPHPEPPTRLGLEMDLRGELVRLRAPVPEDAPHMAEYISIPEVARTLEAWAKAPYSVEQALDWIGRHDPSTVNWAIDCLADDAFIG